MKKKTMRAIALIALVIFGANLLGCRVGHFLRDRVYDATDLINFKFMGSTQALGFGAKLEATDYFGAGLGVGSGYDGVEFFGRRGAWGISDSMHFAVYGVDGPRAFELEGDTYIMTIGLSGFKDVYPAINRFRVGPEIWLPMANVGMYINIAEIFDFVGGFINWDPAKDDGLPLGAVGEESPLRQRHQPPESQESQDEPDDETNTETKARQNNSKRSFSETGRIGS